MGEYKSQYDDILASQPYISRELRASLIDWLFEVSYKMRIEDRSVLFQAISLMDRYTESMTVPM